MKKGLKKLRFIICLIMCLCISIATFQVGVFADETTTQASAEVVNVDDVQADVQTNNTLEMKDDKSQVQAQESKDTKSVVTQDAQISASLATNNGSIWGTGIITGVTDNGTGDLDELCWNKETGENKGYDNSVANDIIRSFDSITYNVKTSLPALGGEGHKLYYQITLPDDDELSISNSNFIDQIPTPIKKDGKKVYILTYNVPEDYSAGAVEQAFSLYVGNKTQGYKIKPEIKLWLDDENNSTTVDNIEPVIVTTAPMYNIVLAKKGDKNKTKDVYDFNQNNTSDTTYFPENAKGYKNNKVTGYEEIYGVALEIRKPGNGIKGVEFPDSSKPFTFDIDLSNYSLKNSESTQDVVSKGFEPLLYYVNANKNGGTAVSDIPYTNETFAYSDKDKKRHCYDSGDYSFEQEGTTLHVTVKDYKIDKNKFPKENVSKASYWENLNAIREGVFSAFQFKVIYPYKNKDGKKLEDVFGSGTINVSAKVDHMKAISTTGVESSIETLTLADPKTDNVQSNTWEISQQGKREHQIYYSKRGNWTAEYTNGQKWGDGDIAPAGATNVAFTISYDENNVGAGDLLEDIPVAINQFVLFNKSALKNVSFSNAVTDKGYDCKILYAVYQNDKNGLDNETMKTAKMSDFKFYEEAPKEGCDGVLVQYRGCNTGIANLGLIAQFNADIDPKVKTDQVYMITAVTNSWTEKDFADKTSEVLKSSNKTNEDDLTREDWSKWVKSQNKDAKVAKSFVKGVSHSPVTMDHRDVYTVPNYTNGVYDNDQSHQFSVTSADGLYIVPYEAKVVKKVAQLGDNGNPLQKFSVSNKQRYVDYVINGSLKYWNNVEPEKDTTTVYFEDTLPKGLTYIEGSAYWGGQYQSKFPNQGIVKNGQVITPEINHNADGTTTLKWTIPKVALQNGALPDLHYSCKIGDEVYPENDVANNETLKTSVSIYTDEDKRPFTSDNENTASTSISILKDKSFYLTKTGKPLLELNDLGNFNLLITNTSSSPIDHLCAIDTMPQDGIGDTIMKGEYKLSTVSLNAKALGDTNDIELWYTNNEAYKGKTAALIPSEVINEENGWKQATMTVNENGDIISFTGDGLIGSWPTAIAYKDAKLDINKSVSIQLEYDAIAAEHDHLANILSTLYDGHELPSKAKVDIVKRSLEGTVWVDHDKDGKLENGETRVGKVKVTILKKNGDNYEPFEAYEGYVEENGQVVKKTYPTTIETDENGHYKFVGLPEGEFKVVFESGKKDISHYGVTKSDIGEVEESSKVKKENVDKNDDTLNSGSILDITMPSKEEMVSKNEYSYNLPDQNLGLTVPSIIIEGQKTWDDHNNQDRKRPNSITVKVLDDNNEVVASKTVTADDHWKYHFDNLPQYDDAMTKKIKYSIFEDDVDKYTTDINGYNITNHYTPEEVSISGIKTWIDDDNQDGLRPRSIKVHLLADGDEIAEQDVTSEQNWKYDFGNLPKYKDGKEIKYTVKEDKVIGYTTSIDGFNIKNTHQSATVNVSGTKTWKDQNNQDGKRLDDITVRLYADGQEIKHKTVTAEDDWKYNFKDLPKYNKGQEITYTVSEDEVAGYTTDIDGYNITNIHEIEKTNVKVSKVWNDHDNQDGKRPDYIIIHLYANDEDTGKTVELNEENQWTSSFDDLDSYQNGQKITYTVQEDSVKDYKVGIIGNQEAGYIITNSHAIETVHLKGTKTWEDHDNQAKKRPTSIKVRLYADGIEVAAKDVTENQQWKYDFGELAKYKDGKEVVYTVSEDYVNSYTTSIDGLDITNTYVPVITTTKNDSPIHKLIKVLTGDQTNIMLYVIICLLSMLGLYFLKKQKA